MFEKVKADYTWEDVGNDASGKVYSQSEKQTIANNWNANAKELNDNIPNEKLKLIKEMRLVRLQETDYMANSDYTMPDNIKTWRQQLRDLPANYNTETKYDELLEMENGKYKHSIWEKP
tara:strand:- start:394 stop:750 length:357 start_codon:yes stop_codon:yes gene_type:complete